MCERDKWKFLVDFFRKRDDNGLVILLPSGGHPSVLNELYRGFVGCMRYIQIDRELKQIDNNQGDIETRG